MGTKAFISTMGLSASLLIGCSQQQPEVEVAEKFWSAMAAENMEVIKDTISDPSHMQYLDGWTIDIDEEGYKIGELTDAGVAITWFEDCYTDVTHPTVIAVSGGQPKVDLGRTMQSMFRASAGQKPIRQYCHSFKDQPMQGVLNGEAWSADHINRQMFDFGTHKKASLKIVPQPCSDERCHDLTTAQITISNLNWDGTGGNFSAKENITIFTPPSTNEVITDGSYRISKTTEGLAKLELSFKQDESTRINGYVVFDQNYLDGMADR